MFKCFTSSPQSCPTSCQKYYCCNRHGWKLSSGFRRFLDPPTRDIWILSPHTNAAWNFLWSRLKVSYYEKQVFFGLYVYKLVLSEPAENKQFLHGLCSPPTGKTALLQAVQILLLLLCNGVSSGKIAVSHNVVTQSSTRNLLSCWLYKSTSVSIFCSSYRTTKETVVAFHF